MHSAWKHDVLWLCPPFQHLEAVVEKIHHEQAEGIILIPLWKRKCWFHALGTIAVKWWDLPMEDSVFQTPQGTPIPPKRGLQIRVVIFNAAGTLPRHSQGPWSILSFLQEHTPSLNGRVSTFTALQDLVSKDWESPTLQDMTQLRSVIASTLQHSAASPFIKRILTSYDAELNQPKLARDVDPRVRGPFGVAKIELKDSARPLARKPFRTLGERETAMKMFIDKYLQRGWIRPSKSEWAAQAFVVPKPDTPDKQKQWRMVVDYRYLNTQTKDDPFPLPLIENLIGKQADNRL